MSSSTSRSGARTFGIAALCLVAAVLLAAPSPSTAACDSFCSQVPADALADVPQCNTCAEEEAMIINTGESFDETEERPRPPCLDDPDVGGATCKLNRVDHMLESACFFQPLSLSRLETGFKPLLFKCNLRRLHVGCCEDFCQWVPANTKDAVPLCAQCDRDEVRWGRCTLTPPDPQLKGDWNP
jgi:hypothetical protein